MSVSPRRQRPPRDGCRMCQMAFNIDPSHPTDIAGNFKLAVGLARRRKRRAQRAQHRRGGDQRKSAKAALRKPTINAIGNPLSEPMATGCTKAGVRRDRMPRAAHTFKRSPGSVVKKRAFRQTPLRLYQVFDLTKRRG